MMNLKVIFSFLIILTIFLGCATKSQKNQISVSLTQWETKALVKNLRENKSQSLTIDISAIKNEKMRLEISALMGFQVASFVMSPSEISYIIFGRKLFVYGQNSERSFRPVLAMPLHPMNLMAIAFDEFIQGPGWHCQDDQAGLPVLCQNLNKEIKVTWGERTGGKKKVFIQGPQFEMLWHFSEPSTQVQVQRDLFNLKQPPGFKAVHID